MFCSWSTRSKTYENSYTKKGRLTEETMSFLSKFGLEFDEVDDLTISSKCGRVQLIKVRDDDIPRSMFIEASLTSGLLEKMNYWSMDRLNCIEELNFAQCRLNIAVPEAARN